MTRDDGRRWKGQWQAVEELERQDRLNRPLPPAESIARALGLIDLACKVTGGWPPAEDRTLSEEDLAANDRWVEVRRRLGAP